MLKSLKPLLALASVLLFLWAPAQEEDYRTSPLPPSNVNELLACRKVFLGFGMGINNNTGLIGPHIEVGIAPKVAVGGGVGLGAWGTKAYFEGKYYFRDCYKGGAIGIAFTRSSGINGIIFEDEDPFQQPQDVQFNLLPQTNLALTGYHYFKMGKRHRFFLCYGYSVELTTKKYIVIGPNMPSRDLVNAINLLAPGGLILGLGFSFGL